MRILYLCINSLIRQTSGPRVHVISVCRELSKLGHTVLLVHPKGNSFENENNELGFKTLALPPRFVLDDKPIINRIVTDILYTVIISIFRPQFIYERENGRRSMVSFSNILNIPRIVELNGWELRRKKTGTLLENEQADIERFNNNFKGAKAIICSSPGVRNKVLEYINIEKDRVFFIPNGVDVEKFSPPKTGNKIDRARVIIGYIGGFTDTQDIKTILDAISILINECIQLELRMIGPAQHELLEMISSRKLSGYIKIYGPLPNKQLPAELWQMDICIAAYSRKLLETVGSLEGAMKIWEYWAACRPVIATDIKSSESYHHHLEKRYIAVQPENPGDMAEAIRFLINHPKEKQKIASRGFEYARKNSWQNVVSKIESIMLDK